MITCIFVWITVVDIYLSVNEDRKHTSKMNPKTQKVADLQHPKPKTAFNVSLIGFDNIFDPNNVPSNNKCDTVETDDNDEDEDDEDIQSDDFEKTHTLCAAFTVVSLVLLFVFEFVTMVVYLIISNGTKSSKVKGPMGDLLSCFDHLTLS